MSTNPGLFADVGDHLLPLANHSDREVRWRVAYFISKVPSPDAGMRQAIAVLSSDPDETTQVYVRACARDADTHCKCVQQPLADDRRKRASPGCESLVAFCTPAAYNGIAIP